jgi:hypothetical protein
MSLSLKIYQTYCLIKFGVYFLIKLSAPFVKWYKMKVRVYKPLLKNILQSQYLYLGLVAYHHHGFK